MHGAHPTRACLPQLPRNAKEACAEMMADFDTLKESMPAPHREQLRSRRRSDLSPVLEAVTRLPDAAFEAASLPGAAANRPGAASRALSSRPVV